MKKLFVALLATFVLSSAFATAALAAIEVSGDAYVSVNTKYLWRGFDLSEDDNYVVQPGADVSFKGFTVSWWGNISENTGDMNEVDLTIDYSFDVTDLVSMSVGNILYDVDGFKDTNELYVGATLNTILSPSLTVYWDYDECEEDGYFVTASVGHTFELNDKAGLNLGALVSYNGASDYAVGDYHDFHNAELSLGLDYAVTDQIAVSPAVLYSTPLSDTADDTIDDEVTAGVTVTLSF